MASFFNWWIAPPSMSQKLQARVNHLSPKMINISPTTRVIDVPDRWSTEIIAESIKGQMNHLKTEERQTINDVLTYKILDDDLVTMDLHFINANCDSLLYIRNPLGANPEKKVIAVNVSGSV